jgi:hypothetical protein
LSEFNVPPIVGGKPYAVRMWCILFLRHGL